MVLVSILPLCWFFTGKLLRATQSSFGTKCLYWFSPNHIEKQGLRSWSNNKILYQANFPNLNNSQSQVHIHLFSPPPLKDHYQHTAIKVDRNLVVINVVSLPAWLLIMQVV